MLLTSWSVLNITLSFPKLGHWMALQKTTVLYFTVSYCGSILKTVYVYCILGMCACVRACVHVCVCVCVWWTSCRYLAGRWAWPAGCFKDRLRGLRMEERSEGWNCPALKGLDESKEKDTRIFLGLIRVTLTLVSGPICQCERLLAGRRSDKEWRLMLNWAAGLIWPLRVIKKKRLWLRFKWRMRGKRTWRVDPDLLNLFSLTHVCAQF